MPDEALRKTTAVLRAGRPRSVSADEKARNDLGIGFLVYIESKIYISSGPAPFHHGIYISFAR